MPSPQSFIIRIHHLACVFMRRYAIGQYVDQSGDVISHLNISSASTEDGGLYACVASNTLATVEHKARLNIYGTLRDTRTLVTDNGTWN